MDTDAAMDTVEWGTSAPPDEGSGRARYLRTGRLREILPRPAAVVLASLGFLALLGTELLPWATVRVTGGSDNNSIVQGAGAAAASGVSIGLERLSVAGTLVYQFGWVALLGLAGMVLAGRPSARQRGVIGCGLGLAAGLLVMVVSMIRSVQDSVTGTSNVIPENVGISVGPGALLAFVALVLVVASLAVAIWQSGTVPGWYRDDARKPERAAGGTAPEQPVEVTVSATPPLDDSYFARPE